MVRLRGMFLLAALLVIGAVGCGDDDDGNPVDPGGGPADVTIQIVGDLGTNSFSPNPDTVTVGQTVSWHNADATAHTATSFSTGAGSFGTGAISPGGTSVPKAMNTAGSFDYRCTIHTSMTGTLVVIAP